ncbi:hypothetical protein LJB99_02815 [Deltaproteobacteria bacterium OttesenSCG-928-K17]|nr:hypothetical protein [Deltaproteobacteria bacterium OttesenSCG-928-K17]
MALQKPQVAVCIDGKAHIWMIVAEDTDQGDGSRLEHRWCKKCGCLTQVGFGPDNQPVVAVDEDGSPHLATPKILNALIK